jgi:lysophospholipid acyltransferase (LPLAT)-like uncharacterized protein
LKRIPGLVYTSPIAFTLRQRIALATIPLAIATTLKALNCACRREVRNSEYVQQVIEEHGRVILAIWHESIVMAPYHYRGTGFHGLTSYSFDGEMAARILAWLGLPSLRGSSNRGGKEALANLAAALEHVPLVGFTLDGPRGPRRVAKPGIAVLAARTQTPIVPHAFAVQPAWRLRSWDRLPIPKPFGRIVSACGVPIPTPPASTPEGIEHMRQQVENALNALHEELERELCGTPML